MFSEGGGADEKQFPFYSKYYLWEIKRKIIILKIIKINIK